LDSKESADFELIYGVPKYFEFLNAESKDRWAEVKEGNQIQINYSCLSFETVIINDNIKKKLFEKNY
jgi:hypothetical protein